MVALNFEPKTYDRGRYIARLGKAEDSFLILNGLAFRQKITCDGGRQILSLHIPGDLLNLEASILRVADYNVEALTECHVAAFKAEDIVALIDEHPRLGRALWADSLVDGSISREWGTSLGRRSARQRVAHLLCELAKRLELAGLGDHKGFQLPMTQEQLADATGLTPIHVNRTLKALYADGLIDRHTRSVTVLNWEQLRKEAGFGDLYLHLHEAA